MTSTTKVSGKMLEPTLMSLLVGWDALSWRDASPSWPWISWTARTGSKPCERPTPSKTERVRSLSDERAVSPIQKPTPAPGGGVRTGAADADAGGDRGAPSDADPEGGDKVPMGPAAGGGGGAAPAGALISSVMISSIALRCASSCSA